MLLWKHLLLNEYLVSVCCGRAETMWSRSTTPLLRRITSRHISTLAMQQCESKSPEHSSGNFTWSSIHSNRNPNDAHTPQSTHFTFGGGLWISWNEQMQNWIDIEAISETITSRCSHVDISNSITWFSGFDRDEIRSHKYFSNYPGNKSSSVFFSFTVCGSVVMPSCR